MKAPPLLGLVLLPLLCLSAQTPSVPDWAHPGSATRQQVPPPPDYRRASTHFRAPIGLFEGQSDIGTAVVPGAARFDATARTYTIDSAGYNIWYTRDEFRYLWKTMSGDVSLAATIAFPNPEGYFDRKTVLVFRQDLDDDSKEIMVALHGGGLVHLAQRPEKGGEIKEDHRVDAATVFPQGKPAPGQQVRLGIEKKGDRFALYLSTHGEPLRHVGTTGELVLAEPFYVGIGFCSHLPATVDTTVVSEVQLEPRAGRW